MLLAKNIIISHKWNEMDLGLDHGAWKEGGQNPVLPQTEEVINSAQTNELLKGWKKQNRESYCQKSKTQDQHRLRADGLLLFQSWIEYGSFKFKVLLEN